MNKAILKDSELNSHGLRCTSEQSDWIASQEPIKNSNCPIKTTWMHALVKSSVDKPSSVLINIGCNRGDDFALRMREWSRNASYSYEFMKPYLQRSFSGGRSCPLDSEINLISQEKIRDVRGFCVEPMKSTFDIIDQMYKELGWDTAVKIIHAAASSYPHKAQFPIDNAGVESVGLGSQSKYGTDTVDVITVDDLVQKNNIESVDILSIDTEGNDMRVIFGSLHSLDKIRFLEFEYHVVNRWQKSDLQDLIDILDQYNFDCFWQSNTGILWRLTGCWHDSYYEKRFWSNIACCNRNEKSLHQAMVTASEPKIFSLNNSFPL